MTDAELVAALAEQTKAVLDHHRAGHDAVVAGLRLEIKELREQLSGIPAGKDGKDGRDGSDGAPGEPGQPGERGVPGEPGQKGEPGAPGRDGRDGRDGKDGIASLDDLRAEVGKAVTGLRAELEPEIQGRVQEIVAALPTMQYKGVFSEGTTYRAGECVTWAGSLWHANEATAERPGDGSKAWTLAVKRGRDGKDARA